MFPTQGCFSMKRLFGVLFSVMLLSADLSPAHSTCMQLTGAGKVCGAGGGGGSFALTYQDAQTSPAAATPITYSGFTVAGGATRTIAIVLWYGGVPTGITSMKIDGVNCTQISSAFANIGGDQSADVWVSNSAIAGGTVSVEVTYA